jgi:hypothetical protein
MVIFDQLGKPIIKLTRPSFGPGFRLEESQLVVDQNHTLLQRPRP